MTDQEAFETMVRHLRKQGRKSKKPGSYSCLYYGSDGLMCAVGCLIPEEQYSRELEYKPAKRIQELVPAISELSLDMLCLMQNLHDCQPVEAWEEGFEEIAKSCNLTLPPLESEASHA